MRTESSLRLFEFVTGTWYNIIIVSLFTEEVYYEQEKIRKSDNQIISALYCRISLDDGGDNESMGISNQKIMLRDFTEKKGMFQLIRVLCG